MDLKQLFIEHGKLFSKEFLALYFKERSHNFTMNEMFARHFIYPLGGKVGLFDIFADNPMKPVGLFDNEHMAFQSVADEFSATHRSFSYSSHPTLANSMIVAYSHVVDSDGTLTISPHTKHQINIIMCNYLYGDDVQLEVALACAVVNYFDDAAQNRKEGDIKINFA